MVVPDGCYVRVLLCRKNDDGSFSYFKDKVSEKVYNEGESVFVLRARDELSTIPVAEWIQLADARGLCIAKRIEARAVLVAMERYKPKKLPG